MQQQRHHSLVQIGTGRQTRQLRLKETSAIGSAFFNTSCDCSLIVEMINGMSGADNSCDFGTQRNPPRGPTDRSAMTALLPQTTATSEFRTRINEPRRNNIQFINNDSDP